MARRRMGYSFSAAGVVEAYLRGVFLGRELTLPGGIALQRAAVARFHLVVAVLVVKQRHLRRVGPEAVRVTATDPFFASALP